MSKSLSEQLVSAGFRLPLGSAPAQSMRFAPRIDAADAHPRAAEVVTLANELIGTRSHALREDALSAGRDAVARALSELGLFGWRVTPPRVRVTVLAIVVPCG